MNYIEAKDELSKLLHLIRVASATLDDARQKLSSIPEDLEKFNALKQTTLAALEKERLEIAEEFTRTLEEIKKLGSEGKETIEQLAKEKSKGFPWLAQAYDDLYRLRDGRIALYLERKSPPAPTAAENLRQISKERREAEKAARMSKYLVDYCKYLAPWLDEYIGIESDELDELLADIHSSWQKKEKDFEDEARKHYGPRYDSFSESEKLQKRLNWYWDKPDKPDWRLGRDYERYIGYLYEKDGWAVQYHGIKGYEDLGRDLICSKGTKTEIVQCKRWSQDKQIHEKHLYYLFGTSVEYYIEHIGTNNIQADLFGSTAFNDRVIPRLITTTDVSPKAKQVAQVLGIQIDKRQFRSYPSIKCNVSLANGEKIFHLPFDQQYDTIKIDEERLEAFMTTIVEAEGSGFRHAYRWSGNSE